MKARTHEKKDGTKVRTVVWEDDDGTRHVAITETPPPKKRAKKGAKKGSKAR